MLGLDTSTLIINLVTTTTNGIKEYEVLDNDVVVVGTICNSPLNTGHWLATTEDEYGAMLTLGPHPSFEIAKGYLMEQLNK